VLWFSEPKMSWDTQDNAIVELDARKSRRTSILNSLDAIVGALKAQVAERLYRGLPDGGLPNYDSTTWDASTQSDIASFVRQAYDMQNSMNPLKGINPTKVDQTTRDILEGIYSTPRDTILEAIGTSTDFGGIVQSAHGEGMKHISQLIAQTAAKGYTRAIHGDAVLAAMKKRYSLVDGKYDPSELKRTFGQLAALDMSGELTTDVVYRIARK